MKKDAAVLLFFVGISLVMTFPLVFHMAGSVPGDLGDPLYFCWALDWNVKSIVRGFSHYWDANIYYPNDASLAYNEHALGLSLLVLPVALLFKNPLITYNSAFLLSFILSGFGAYLLVKYLTNNRSAAVIAGVIFAFSPYRFARIYHLNILSSEWLPFIFLCLHRYFSTKKFKDLLLCAVFFMLQVATSYNVSVYLAVIIIPLLFFLIIKHASFADKKTLFELALTGAVCFILLLPLVLPYIRLDAMEGTKRSIYEVINFSPDIRAYFSTHVINRLYGKITAKYWRAEGCLFPGGIVIIMTVWLFVMYVRGKSEKAGYTGFYFLLCAWAVLLSLGPVIHYGGKALMESPYILLYRLFPGMSGVRVPSRFGIFVVLSLSVLAGYAADRLIKEKNKTMITALIIGGLLVEYNSVPLPLAKTGKAIDPAYEWLARDRDGYPIIEFPFSSDFEYMFASTRHDKHIFNGNPGRTPLNYPAIKEVVSSFPSEKSADMLRVLGVKYILIHRHKYSESEYEAIRGAVEKNASVRIAKTFEKTAVYGVLPRDGVWEKKMLLFPFMLRIR